MTGTISSFINKIFAGKKRIRILIIAAVVLLSAVIICVIAHIRLSRKWTICLYLCGSNLESKQGWASATLNELKSLDMPDNVTFVIQTGGSSKWRSDEVTPGGNQRFIVRDGQLKEIGSGSFSSMGEADALGDFLQFCASHYRAGKCAVILWDHGAGPLKGACFDEYAGFDALTLDELEQALAAGVKARGGKKYDIIGFDACLMASLETARTISDYSHLMVASEEIETGAGWDYAPFLKAIGDGNRTEDAASALCTGYMDKCGRNGKSAAATLSVVDLSKTEAIVNALDKAMNLTGESYENDTKTLRSLSFCTRSAESFGGTTKSEGISNLTDLYGMAKGNSDESKKGRAWEALAAAVENAVLTNVSGSAASGAHGLSIWYPLNSTDREVADYAGISPIIQYGETLNRLFSAQRGSVKFSDPSSVKKDGSVSVSISPDTSDSFFDLYVVNRRVDGSYSDTNVDMEDDWDNLTFSYNPSLAVAITLDGMVLDAQTIAYDEDYILFSCPVTLNGEDAYLRIGWFWDDENNENADLSGHYELIGIWNGIDHVSGLSDRFLEKLSDGDEVCARSLETGEVRGRVIIQGEPVIDDIPMKPGHYECWFVALDLYGNEYRSDTIRYKVTKKGTEIIKKK